MATVIPVEELRVSPTAALFEGGDQVGVSIFVTEHGPGERVPMHFHPYPETFVVRSGTALFTVGDDRITVAAGHFVLVPADTPHGFENMGDEPLRLVSVHPRGEVEQTWL